ncbi:hypothetical protein FXO38_02418 [Capsicum annuum]|nr:hypothetical protein FXO38_02418 [Capsicum annuum]
MNSIKYMEIEKSLRVDTISIEFYTSQWNTMKSDVVLVLQEFFTTGKMLKTFSCTTVTLVKKVPAPTVVKDYRPIACCTIFYKIITKVLTNIIE